MFKSGLRRFGNAPACLLEPTVHRDGSVEYFAVRGGKAYHVVVPPPATTEP